MTTDDLYSDNWLLAYEAKIKGWLPSQDRDDHINEDEFFGKLKRNNVSFYDSTKQVTPVDVSEFRDDDVSKDDTNDTGAYYFWY
jgi:hypothetical protein